MTYFLLSLTVYFFYLILKYRKGLYMLQQNAYNNSHRYLKWLFKNSLKNIFTYELIVFLILPLFFFIPDSLIMIINFLVYSVLFYFELKGIKKEQHKKPFVITKRIRRMMYTIILLFITLILVIRANYYDNDLAISYLLIALFGYLSYIIVYLVNIINYPAERIVYYYYKFKAVKKIRSMPNLQVIGITGSYGKTSSKNILNSILSYKFNSLATPKSFNTPYGLMSTINNDLDKFEDIFIAEMGACERGHIKELCNFVKPKYGIITKIGLAHLETFKSEDNIQKGKFELIESLPSNGIGILNKDDEKQVNYKIKNNCKIVWIGIEEKDVDVRAVNIKLSHSGTTFDVKFKDDSEVHSFTTNLLGEHNIYNILSSIALGKELGITINDLKQAVRSLKPTEHRLELKKYQDVILIDDAFNSNPVGSKMALDVLNLMPGKKIIVTPGMIELGDKQYALNKEFGEQIAAVCDEVILIGEKQTKPIIDGLKEQKYPRNNIHILNDVKLAFSLVNELKAKETYVLLENDLPDLFTE